MSSKQSPVVTIGRGGWAIHYPTVETASGRSKSTLSGYGNGAWAEHLDTIAPDALVIDSTVIGEDEIVDWALRGPMVDADLPPCTVSKLGDAGCFGGNGPRPWTPEDGSRFGNARSLDSVSVDVYAELAAAFGAKVYPAHAAA